MINERILSNYHSYLNDVVTYWQKYRTLGGFSKLAKLNKVKSITKEQFFQYGLDKLTSVPRELSDKIRLELSERDMVRRYKEPVQTSEQPTNEAEHSMRELLNYLLGKSEIEDYQIISKFDKDLVTWFNISYDDMRSASREDVLEVKAARNLMKEVQSLPEVFYNSCYELKHAILSMILADEFCIQPKIDMGLSGRPCKTHQDILQKLQAKGFLDDVEFAKIQTHKGNVLFFVVFKTAPDILVAIDADNGAEYHTIKQFNLKPYDGEVLIATDEIFGAYSLGTRANLIGFLDGIRDYKPHAEAVQSNVPASAKGKLLYDLRSMNELKLMFNNN
jgi:hypothetical protein